MSQNRWARYSPAYSPTPQLPKMLEVCEAALHSPFAGSLRTPRRVSNTDGCAASLFRASFGQHFNHFTKRHRGTFKSKSRGIAGDIFKRSTAKCDVHERAGNPTYRHPCLQRREPVFRSFFYRKNKKSVVGEWHHSTLLRRVQEKRSTRQIITYLPNLATTSR